MSTSGRATKYAADSRTAATAAAATTLAAYGAQLEDGPTEPGRSSVQTDPGFLEKQHEQALEREMASMFVEVGRVGRVSSSRPEEKVMDIGGEQVPVDTRNPWEATYDRDGRLIKSSPGGEGRRAASKGPRLMVVEVLAARDIESADFGGTSDPYCQLDLNGAKHKTKTIWKTLRPVWGERFEFVGAKELDKDAVDITLFDEDLFGAHDFLGAITIPVHLVEEGTKVAAHWVKLMPKKPAVEKAHGRLTLSCYLDADVPGRLRVGVVRAAAIEAADFGGTSDPYVRVNLLRLGEDEVPRKDDVRRTQTQYKTLDPVWGETFVFEHVNPGSTSCLLLELFDYDLIGADDELGQIVLPINTLPQARPGDRFAQPNDHPWAEHSSKRDVTGEVNVMVGPGMSTTSSIHSVPVLATSSADSVPVLATLSTKQCTGAHHLIHDGHRGGRRHGGSLQLRG